MGASPRIVAGWGAAAIVATTMAIAQDAPRSGVVEAGLPTVAPRQGHGAGVEGSNVNTTQDASPQNETSIAVDPENPLNLVGGTNDYRNGEVDAGFATSLDGGLTWLADTLAGVNSTLGKFDAQGDPAVAAHRGGVFYYSFIDFNRADDQNRLAVAKSLDGGLTWPQLGVIADHSGAGSHDFEDKEYLAVDATGGIFDGNVYVTWTRFPVAGSTRIMFSRSADGGVTFSSPVQISDATFGYQGSVPAVGPNGQIYVAWLHNAQIEIDRSANGGLTWGADVVVANIDSIPSPLPGAAFRDNSFPTLAVDTSGGPHHGAVYVAWADQSGVGQGPDILFSRSTDGGATWTAPIRVSDDTNDEYQWFPWISVDPGGFVHAVFFDRRDAPVSALYHTYASRSMDGGLSFEPNTRVSEEISDSGDDGFDGTFIGDYNGIASTSLAAHPYWTDVRATNANAEGYTAALTSNLTLTASGACPGVVTLAVAGATPGGAVTLFRGGSAGSFVLPGGPCAGTELGLDDPRRLPPLTADGDGEASLTRNFPAAACGLLFQALDVPSCQTSDVEPLQ